jgi:hypothetical protein
MSFNDLFSYFLMFGAICFVLIEIFQGILSIFYYSVFYKSRE